MSTKITLSAKDVATLDTKYTRIVVTEESLGHHRFVETADGHTEYRQGAGKWSEVTPRTFRTLVRSLVQSLKSHKVEFASIALNYTDFPKLQQYDEAWFTSTIAENLALAAYDYTVYKSKKDEKHTLKEIVILNQNSAGAKAGFARGCVVAHYTNSARDIANTHGDDLTPKALAAAAKKLATGTKVTVKILGLTEIKKLKMNLVEAVGKGSHNEPQFIVMEYWGKGNGKLKMENGKVSDENKPLVLIGKGITYDTGGLNVKPSGSMHDMHMDMSGGSSVMAAIVAASKLGLKKNIVALIPAAENAISSRSMRAGDIVTAMNGTTVEILHTDAEGRLVLADALTYSERYKPKAIIDVATLTGAALVALGQQASAVMTRDLNLETTLRTLGEESGDLVWPLPLWDEYKSPLKSARADISNIATNFARWGGAIEGGMFLDAFAPKNVPWAHLDIAPRMDSIPSDKLAKGSTGEPVRLLIKWLETY
ncbi:leucyl aminopeptidase [Patescibacteria group bacterium]|nr:leucyl aminopeptidase [Patescibacteria group bacterium]